MRRKYRDCQRQDGNCTLCPIVNYSRDCHNRPINKLKWARLSAGIGQQELAEKSKVNVRQIQRVELEEAEIGNLTAKNLIALAKVLNIDPRDLI